MANLKFALNHMVAPQLSVGDFLSLAANLEVDAVELRNDLVGGVVAGGLKPTALRKVLQDNGQRLISINALQRFNQWNSTRREQALELIDYAADAGAEALVLVPANDGTVVSKAELTDSLSALGEILVSSDVIGLVEPLGFDKCTLRSKALAVNAINDSATPQVFKLVHDTFHHYVAGESALFAESTGLVHLSGVVDSNIATADLLDDHRVLIDQSDLIGNVQQIKQLLASGFNGYFSFEPFAKQVHQTSNIEADIKASMAYLDGAIV